jgi:hypothetical protein
MSNNKSDVSEEDYREGMTQVQAFSTPVIRPEQENPPRLRKGRRARVIKAKSPESAGETGAAEART